METLQGPGIADILHDLDDETLRRILKMSPHLSEADLRRNEGQVAVDTEER